MLTVLFVCTHNAGRSRMAETFFNQMAQSKARAVSAGTQPAETINPVVVEAMSETGVGIQGTKPRQLTPELLKQADMVVSMGCGEACPLTRVAQRDWNLADPAGKSLAEIRIIRDEIREKVRLLLSELKI